METQPFQSEDRWPTADSGQSVPLCISPILPYSTSLEESELRPNKKNVACPTNLAVSNLVPLLLEMPIVRPLLLPSNINLINPQGEVHPLIADRTLQLAVWTISGKYYLRREFQKQLPNLLQAQDEKVHSQITICPGECGLAGVINNRLMHFDVM